MSKLEAVAMTARCLPPRPQVGDDDDEPLPLRLPLQLALPPPPPEENDKTLPLMLPSVCCGVGGSLSGTDARENATDAAFERNDHKCNHDMEAGHNQNRARTASNEPAPAPHVKAKAFVPNS